MAESTPKQPAQTVSKLPTYLQEIVHGIALEEYPAEHVTEFARSYTRQEQASQTK